MWRRGEHTNGLTDVLEVIHGIGTTLMVISAKLDDIITLLEEENDGEADA